MWGFVFVNDLEERHCDSVILLTPFFAAGFRTPMVDFLGSLTTAFGDIMAASTLGCASKITKQGLHMTRR